MEGRGLVRRTVGKTTTALRPWETIFLGYGIMGEKAG